MAPITALRAKFRDLKSRGLLHGSIKQAIELHVSREGKAARQIPRSGRILELQASKRRPVIVRFLDDYRSSEEPVQRLYDRIFAPIKDENRRWREWSLGLSASNFPDRRSEWYRIREIGSNRNWSKKSTFQRGAHVHSVAQIVPGGAVRVELTNLPATLIKPPRGYRWTVDTLGICLASKAGNDYHPSACELYLASTDRCRGLVGTIKRNAKQRALAAREQRQQAAKERKAKLDTARLSKRAEQEGCAICLADSLRAGNCQAGTTAWVRQHGLDPALHYTPSHIQSLANGQADRVAIVIAVAIKRHTEEMRQGFCDLKRHGR